MSKEILLVSPPYPSERRKAMPPLGIASIAGYLEENGYRGRIELMDGFYLAKKYGYSESLKMVKEKIEKEKPFIVGCSVLHTNEEEALGIIKTAKKAEAHIVVGNHMATTAHRSYSKLVTAVVRGEGEVTTKELMDALFSNRELHGVKGLTFYDGKRIVTNPHRELIDLDEIPPPAFHLLEPVSKYDSLLAEESRGCCFKCSFCSIAGMYRSYRLKSPERIRLEIENIAELGVRIIDLIGELVLLNEDRALRIADIMEEFDCSWKIDAHPTFVVKRKKILPVLAKKGLKGIEMGVESGNQHSLDLYNKQTTPQINNEAAKAVLDAGIFPHLDFINFEPYLTMEDLKENIQFVMRHIRIISMAPSYPLENLFKPWIPIPGTPMFERAKSEGLVVSIEKSDTDSYPKMRNAQHFFVFRDEHVKRVADSIDYFLKRYGERYHQMLDQLTREEGYLFSDSPKATAIAAVPAYILCMAYAVVKNNIPGQMIIDWYCQQRLDAIERGEYGDSLSRLPIPPGAFEKIINVFKELAPAAH